jgi:Leucine-rich repeat (LRR) protein
VSPWLPHIRSVALTGLSSPNEPLRSLRESPYTTGVTSLRLETTNFPSIPIILEELFAAPLGKQLTTLSMRHGYGSADETMEAITQNGPVLLTDFDLFHMGFGPTAARTFADTGLAKQTEVLRLNGNALTSNGLSILATATERLRVLDLTKTSLAPVAAELMAQAPAFRSLRKLILDGNPLGTDGIKAISRSQHLTGLRSLGLANTQCDNAALRYITRGGVWSNLVELDLRNNPISDTGAKHLLSAPPAPDLTSLVLPTRNLTDTMRGELLAKFGELVSWAE